MPLVQSSSASVYWRIRDWDELPAVQSRARAFLGACGFDVRQQWCVVIALTEAATNAIKFAGGGGTRLAWHGAPRAHALLEVIDEGPGIRGVERAAADFFSEGADWRTRELVAPRRGNGTGLGCIRRMMDVVTVANRDSGGLRLVARKYLDTEWRADEEDG